jgi:hypothetical protein
MQVDADQQLLGFVAMGATDLDEQLPGRRTDGVVVQMSHN